eukprot:c8980_g1_i1 orf=1-378(-)
MGSFITSRLIRDFWTFTISTTFEGAQQDGNKGSSGTSRHVRALCKDVQSKEALNFLEVLEGKGIQACSDTYVFLLRGCTNMKSLAEGKQIHAHIINCGFKPDIFIGNTLVNMYAKCGSIEHACQVF